MSSEHRVYNIANRNGKRVNVRLIVVCYRLESRKYVEKCTNVNRKSLVSKLYENTTQTMITIIIIMHIILF